MVSSRSEAPMEIVGLQGKGGESVQIMHFLGLFIHQWILIKKNYCHRKIKVVESRGDWFQGALSLVPNECPGQAAGFAWIGYSHRPGKIIGCCLAPAGKAPALPI